MKRVWCDVLLKGGAGINQFTDTLKSIFGYIVIFLAVISGLLWSLREFALSAVSLYF